MGKGQIAYEFLFMFFFLTLAFTVWIVFSSSIQEDILWQKREMHLNDLGLQMQDDFYSAVQMSDGFSRTIMLPNEIANSPYTITSYDANHPYGKRTYLEIAADDYYTELEIPHSVFNNPLQIGSNTLTVSGGLVYVN